MASRAAGLASAAALLLAACGGGGAATTTIPADAASVTAALAAALVTDPEEGGPFDAAAAQCAAEGVVAALGLERSAAMVAGAGGSSPGDPSVIFVQATPEELALVMTAVEGCVAYEAAAPGALAYFGFPDAVATCLGGVLARDGLARPVVEAFLAATDPTADATFADAYVSALAGECSAATGQLMSNDLTQAYGISADGAACAAAAFATSERFRDIVAVWMGVDAGVTDGPAVVDLMSQLMSGCLTPEEMATIGITTTTTTSATSTSGG
jgi:hypothetical protein